MKKRIFSIMDMSKKKTGVAIICGILLVTLGTGFTFAANANASIDNTQVQRTEAGNNDEVVRYPTPGTFNNNSSYTDEEYAALMALKTEDYRELSVSEFDSKFVSVGMIYNGYNPNDENADFMKTLLYSSMELVYSESNETPMISISTGINKQMGNNEYYGAEMNFEIYWTISNEVEMTVGERDDILNACENSIQSTLEGKSRDELQSDDFATELKSEFDTLANELSNNSISLKIVFESLSLVNE